MSEKVPRLVANVDIRTFKLDPMDGFLLTRVDGRLGTRELARETGLPDFSVERSLEKLERLGVIERIDPSAPPPPPRAPEPPPARAAVSQFASLLGAKYDPAELEEPCDLAPEQRKRVLDLYYRLDDLDHYTLLGVTQDADKKAIKRAYFELAAFMHPDRYFKKNLGAFKPKMEVLFTRVTEAHDTLVDKQGRVEYDAYLAEVATTRGMEAMLERALEAAQRVGAPSEPHPAPTSAPTVAQPGPSPGPSTSDLQARREALARRLLGAATRPTPAAARPSPPEPPSAPTYATASDAVDALKRRYEDRIEQANASQLRRYTEAAEEALAKNDLVSAASALGIAVRYAPSDAALALRHQQLKGAAETAMVESYTKQADYEERQQKWLDAARSWQRLAKLRPADAQANARAASCLLRGDGDMHQAAEHAKRAVAAEPAFAGNHVTLAEIYAKAGLHASARRAAEAGLGVDPQNAPLLALLKRLGKG